MEKEINMNLLCPLSLDWLKEPVILNCCGTSVSKEEIEQWYLYKKTCPLCREELNLDKLVLNRNLAYLVEEAIKQGSSKPSLEPRLLKQKWNASLQKINSIMYADTSIGRLKIDCLDPNYSFKTLLIPVIDESGSMAGNPTTQVIYSLKRIVDLSYKNKDLITNMIGYSDTAKSYKIDTSLPIESNYKICDQFGRGGGTYFKEAFREIVSCLNNYKNNVDITSVVIVFLTDGCDSSITKNRETLVDQLKKDINSVWNVDFTIHVIGFTNSHDYDFLNRLRLIGKIEGAYRFADPSEDTDSLSSKIFSIINKISESSSVPIKISDSYEMKIISGEDNIFWMDISKVNFNNDQKIKIKINNCEEINLIVKCCEDENLEEVWTKWYSQLVDQIASEFLYIVSEENKSMNFSSLPCKLHCELLIQRAKRIISNCKEESEKNRTNNLIEQIKLFLNGGLIDKQKLNDLKFEGKFATVVTGKKEITKSNDTLQPSIYASKKNNKIPWIVYKKPIYNLKDTKYSSSEYLKILDIHYDETEKWALENSSKLFNILDDKNNNFIHLCSFIGRFGMLRSLVSSGLFELSDTNSDNLNALDLTILTGNYISAEILLERGAKPTLTNNQIVMSSISKGYKKTLSLLLKYKLIIIDEELASSAPTNNDEIWLRLRMDTGLPISYAIQKGVYETVLSDLDKIETLSFKEILSVFNKPTSDHIRIVDLLIKNKKVDPNEIIEWTDIETGEKDITWPLFACCEKGNLEMLDVLMKYVDKSTINKQSYRGTTCLWIACCNNKLDIIMNLLENGADPNISNFKGDSPLIPACQKGLLEVANILLEVGISIDSFNKNRDSPILICCRTGNYKVMQLLLNKLNPEEVKKQLAFKASIDGFNPLFASVESEKVNCITTCISYGANIEDRTDDDNEIIQGATPLHLACFYGKIKSVETLVQLGADLESKTNTLLYTPLHLAIKQGHKEVVRFLLNNEKSKNTIKAEDKFEKTPIYYAGMSGNEDLFNEFFRNPLADIVYQILILKDEKIEKECTDLLLRYGQSYFCYTYRDIAAITYENGSSILTEAFLTGNLYFTEALIKYMGANINQKDIFGITPAFWMMLYDYKGIELSNVDQNSFTKLSKINEVMKNIQSKMLLKLPTYSGQLAYKSENDIPTGIVKMSYNYDFKTKNKDLLDDYKGKSFSMVGFLDQLNNTKNFPKGKKCLEYLIWDAKIHSIKVLASLDDEFTEYKPHHIMSLYLLTQSFDIFKDFNNLLSNWNPDSILKPFIYSVCQSIEYAKKFKGEVYKCVYSTFQLKKYEIGEILTWDSLTFASTEWKAATELINSKKGIIFIVQSINGRKISNFVKNQSDEDVVFLPFTKFKVLNHYLASVFALGQANIRKSTFMVKEKDIIKAEKEETSIIVELEEVDFSNTLK